MAKVSTLTKILLALGLVLAAPLAHAEDKKADDAASGGEKSGGEKSAGGKSGEVRMSVPDADEAPRGDAPKPEAVGTLAAPTAQELDEGPVRDGRKTLTWIGYHQAKTYSRLFLKTTERVAFDVLPGAGVIKIRMKQTRSKLSNNMRFLDTSYFATALWRVTPRRQGEDLDVEIQMREVVAYKLRRKGDTIRIDFELPTKK